MDISRKKVDNLIDAVKTSQSHYEAALEACSDLFAGIFERLGVNEIRLKKPYVVREFFFNTRYLYLIYNKDSKNKSKFDVKDKDGNIGVLELEDYPPCYDILVETLNSNQEHGQHISESDPTIEDAANAAINKEKAIDAVEQAIKSIFNEYKIAKIALLSAVDCMKGGQNINIRFVGLEDKTIQYSKDDDYYLPVGNFDAPFPFAAILKSVFDTTEYYKTHDIPVSDWCGENDVTRALSKMKVNPSLVEVISESVEDVVLGRKALITTVSELRPIGLHLTSFILFEDMNGWLQTSSFRIEPNTDDMILNYAARYHMYTTLQCDSLKDVAALIKHYGLTPDAPESMLEELHSALKADAESQNFKSVLDYTSLLDELGIQYSFGPQVSDWECYDDSDEEGTDWNDENEDWDESDEYGTDWNDEDEDWDDSDENESE